MGNPKKVLGQGKQKWWWCVAKCIREIEMNMQEEEEKEEVEEKEEEEMEKEMEKEEKEEEDPKMIYVNERNHTKVE